MQSSVKRLIPGKSLLFLCDVQDKFAPKTYMHQGVVETTQWICQVAKLFDIPTLITEQNPPVFGNTYPQMLQALNGLPQFKTSKSTFSMVNSDTQKFLQEHHHRNQVVLVGMETHVCVLQTFLDLTKRGYEVFLPVDCLTSMRAIDRSAALQRMQQAGAVITTFESATFEMLGDYKHKNFKSVLNILKSSKREHIIPHL